MTSPDAVPAPRRAGRLRRAAAAALALVAFVAGLGALDVAITLRSERFARFVEEKLRGLLAAHVTVGAIRFELSDGLVVEDVEVRPREGASPSLRRLRADVAVRPRYRSLVALRLEVARVKVESLVADVTRDPATGEYSFDGLVRDAGAATGPPPRFEVEIEDAAITVTDPELLAPGATLHVGRIDVEATSGGEGRIHVSAKAEVEGIGPVTGVGEVETASGLFSATVRAAAIVAGSEVDSLLAERLAEPMRRAGADGPLSASVSLSGRLGESVSVDAAAELRGLTIRPEGVGYSFDDVRGTFAFSNGRLRVRGLRATHDETHFEVDGEVEWPEVGPPEASLDLRAIRLAIDEELRRALGEAGREAFEILEPSGHADVAVRVDGAIGGPEPPAVRFDVELIDVSLTYVGTYHEKAGKRLGFPYPMNRVNGHVRNDGNETRLALSGYAGHAPFTIDGRLYDDPLDPGVDIVVDAKGAVLDETLRSALDEDARREWDRFVPTGIADVRCRIFQDPGSKTNTDAHVTLRGASAEFVDFPYPVSGLSGVVHIVNADVFVESITGRSGGTTVKVDGTFYGTGLAAAHAVTVVATDANLDAAMLRAVRKARPEIADRLEELQAAGLLDVVYEEVAGAFEETESRIEARMKDVRIRPRGIPYLFDSIAGDLSIAEDELVMSGVTGKLGESKAGGFRVDGRIDLSPGSGAVAVDVDATGVPLDEEIRTAIGIGAAAGGPISLVAARAFDTMRPGGVVGLRGSLAGTVDAPRLVRLSIDLAGTRVAPPVLPYPIEAEAGEASVDADGTFRVSLSRGRFGLATIERFSATGLPLTSPSGGQPDSFTLAADLSVFGLPIEPALLAAATGLPVADVEAMKPGGRLDVDRLHLDVERRDGATSVSGRGRLELADARIDAGVALTSIRGFVDVESFRRDPSGYEVIGRLGDLSAELLRARIDGVGGRITAVPHYVRLEEIGGMIYGGAIDPAVSRVALHTSAPADYEGRLKVTGFELASLAAAFSPKKPEFWGDADLDLEFRNGFGTGASSVVARGEIEVTRGSLVEVPFVAAIFKVLAPPVTPTYTTADAKFRLRRSKIVVDRLRFAGAPISLEGHGRVDFDGTIDLLLVMGLPRILAIPIIDDLVKLLSQTLVAIRVAGPSDNPRVFLENVVTEGFSPSRDLDAPVRRPKGLAFELRRRPAEW